MHALLGFLLVATVALPTLWRGGFDPSSRSMFVALAGAALLVAGMTESRTAAAAARSPLALTLFAIAALSIASVGWTVASRTSAVRWGLVIAGYGAVFVVAATMARVVGAWAIAAFVGVIAIVEALLGLHAVAFHALPDAERLSGVWQPGGTFEYTPALTILEVGALPVFSFAAARFRPAIASCAAAAAVLAGACLGLTGSRLAPALAAVLLLSLIVRPPGEGQRGAAVATAAFVVIGALLGPVILGGRVRAHAPGAGALGAAELAALAAGAAVAWPLARRLIQSAAHNAVLATGAAAIVLAAIISMALPQPPAVRSPELPVRSAVVFGLAATPVRPIHASIAISRSGQSWLHGRPRYWKAALATWLDRPLTGAGAGAYFVAALPHQSLPRSRFAHNLPLELAAELGVLGLLLGLALYGSTAWTISRAGGHERWLLAPTMALFMIANLVDWPWHLAGLGAIWAAASGALAVTRRDG